MSGDLIDGVFEYNLARTWRLADVGEPTVPSSLHARVLAALQAAFVRAGDYDCRAANGIHSDDCFHRLNAVPVRVGQLAKWLFGRGGGSQVRQLRNAIADLSQLEISFVAHLEGSARRVRTPLISFIQSSSDSLFTWDDSSGDLDLLLDLNQRLRDDEMPPHDFILRFADEVHAGLMAGHFQLIPGALVQRLQGADYLMWQTLLCQRPVAAIRPQGEPARFTFTGRDPAIRAWQMGCASLLPSRLGSAVDRAARIGNSLQSRFLIERHDRLPHKGRRRRVGVLVRRLKQK